MPDTDRPEFDWLYGDTRPADGRGADSTRGSAPSTGGPRAASQPGTPQQIHTSVPQPTSPRKRRTGRRVLTALLVLLVAWLAFLIAVPAIAWSKIEQVDASPTSARPPEQPGDTYLLVGSDSREGLTRKEKRQMGAGGVGDIGRRTDTIMLLHIGSGPAVLLSIPRDSLVSIPGHGTTKINAAFALGGPQLLVETVEQSTGIRIDHYIEIGFSGFVKSVDAVGGIEICPTKRMSDPRANLNIKKGCQNVDGLTALGYARSRHTSPIGDIDRAKHQREVVAAVGAKAKRPATILNPWRYAATVNAGAESLRIGEDTGPIAVAKFALTMSDFSNGTGKTCGMPIRDLAVHWDEKRAQALIAFITADNTAKIPDDLCRPTGLPE